MKGDKEMGMSERTAIKTARELNSFPGNMSIQWTQFHHCNAYISQCLRNRFFLIKSYSTIVGIVDDQEADFFEMGKYSPTTSKQMTMIYRERFSDCDRKLISRIDTNLEEV